MEMDWLTRKMFLIPPPARIIQDFEEKWRDIREIHGERRAKFSIRAKKNLSMHTRICVSRHADKAN